MRIFSSRFSVSGTFHIATNSNAAVKMITPLEFFIRGRRDEDGTLLPVKELWVKAHFATLLEALEEPTGLRFKVASDQYAYPDTDVQEYKKSMAQLVPCLSRPR